MNKVLSLVTLLVTSYCVSCGTGGESSTESGPAVSDTAAHGPLRAPSPPVANRARVDLTPRIVGRPVRRSRPASDYLAAHQKSYEAPPLDPGAKAQGQVVVESPKAAQRPGQTFDVTFKGHTFAEATEGGGVDLSFDPQVVAVEKVSVDASVWEFFTSAGEIDNQAGKVTGIAFASFAGRSGDFSIATVTFRRKARGDTKLRVSESPLNPFASGGRRMRVALE